MPASRSRARWIDTPAATIERLIAINVTAPTLLARTAARAFAGRGRGGIINLSSVLALAPEMFEATYSATKAFVLTLSQGLAHELCDTGVRVQAVLPGATRTEIWARSGKDVNAIPAEFVMDPADLVEAALLGFERGEVVTISPLADADGGAGGAVLQLQSGAARAGGSSAAFH